jgi:hypothetical protein
VDAIRIKQEATHDTITRVDLQQERSHCIAKSVRKSPQCNQLATSCIPHGALPRAIQHGIAGEGGSRMKQDLERITEALEEAYKALAQGDKDIALACIAYAQTIINGTNREV